MPKPIVHIELVATDPAASAQFYGDVFGWNLQHDEKFDYHMFSADPGPGGGFIEAGESMGMEHKVNQPLIYIDTDDIDATLEQIEAHGGRRMLPKTEIPGIGWFAIFLDPAGNRMALYTRLS
jgi:predicted enzyme related to lactoylglutathione lyase